ncbi:MAG TPA: sensor domain-containing diguanylate cyclase, partial [Actinocrinis sp.]|uniref:GGDEF domain-containing protein n=1 Tax=Actinocrinis sp. TaxID=1920516 RepID=UPI002DDD88A0
IAAREAQRDLRAAVASISMWERQTGRLRVLANHGKLAAGESAFPKEESYPVSDFPEILLSEDDLGPWIQVADDEYGDPKRVSMLRRRGRHSALIAPIVYNGRAWGELFAARTSDQPVYDREDVDFAAALTAQIAAGLAKADHVRQIERLAYTDQLTGLANRRSFDARLDAAIDRHASDGTVVSLIVCDVNGLKRMNDGHGHDHGDALLVQLAGVMSAAAALLPGSLAARLGGDEFCVLIEGYGADDAVRVAEELCNLALTVRGGEGVACGVASTGDRIGDVITRDRLFRLADAAQYRAKRSRSLHPVVAGRGQPPDAAIFTMPTARTAPPIPGGLVPDRRAYRGRSGLAIESLLTEAFSALDEEAHRTTSAVPTVDRVEVIADVVARGLDAASWYIYRKPGKSEPLGVVRYSVYRTPAEPGSVDDGLLALTQQPVGPEHFTGIEDVLLGGGEFIELSDSGSGGGPDGVPGNGHSETLPPGAAKLAAAGYTGALTIGSGAPDRSQWMVAVLLDSISKQPSPAVPLLRALLAAALLR